MRHGVHAYILEMRVCVGRVRTSLAGHNHDLDVQTASMLGLCIDNRRSANRATRMCIGQLSLAETAHQRVDCRSSASELMSLVHHSQRTRARATSAGADEGVLCDFNDVCELRW